MIPRPKKTIPNNPKVIMVDPKLGTGLHAGSICCLNFESLRAWILSSISYLYYSSVC